MTDYELPAAQDDPPYMGPIRSDDFFTIASAFWLGFFLDQMTFGFLLGLALVWPSRKFRSAYPDGVVAHYLWSVGLFPSRARGIVHPFIRRIHAA